MSERVIDAHTPLDSQSLHDYVAFKDRHATPLKVIFPAADANSLSLLADMLVLDPRRRLSPADALAQHAFFASVTEQQQRDSQALVASRIQTLPSAHTRGVVTNKRAATKRSGPSDEGNEQRRARIGDGDDSDEDDKLLMQQQRDADDDNDGVRKRLEL
jgi:hypothetical protein